MAGLKPKIELFHGPGVRSLGGEFFPSQATTLLQPHFRLLCDLKQHQNKVPPCKGYPGCLGKYFSKCTLILKSWRCLGGTGHPVYFTKCVNYLFCLYTKYLFSHCILGKVAHHPMKELIPNWGSSKYWGIFSLSCIDSCLPETDSHRFWTWSYLYN